MNIAASEIVMRALGGALAEAQVSQAAYENEEFEEVLDLHEEQRWAPLVGNASSKGVLAPPQTASKEPSHLDFQPTPRPMSCDGCLHPGWRHPSPLLFRGLP